MRITPTWPLTRTLTRSQELFTSTVGPLKTASLAYDSKGKSKGVATIQFHKAIDATKAYEQYNKRLVDGSGSSS